MRFTDEAVSEIARIACDINSAVSNIGARRLVTIVERVLQVYQSRVLCDSLLQVKSRTLP